uniref:Ig-like domain-containing protein n=1 Tax=Electrophorus electricus TaxID=8005 RepID=A0A4W4H470_ELEEL
MPIALPVKFSEVSEAQKNKCTVIGEPFELECEVSDAATLVCWYKDGKKLQSHAQALLLSEGTIRKLSVQSAELSDIGSPIVLKCEISDPAAQVCWYKNGTELSPKKELNIQSDGNLRKLILPSAKLSDTGHYMCGNQDDAISFKVDVQGDFYDSITFIKVCIISPSQSQMELCQQTSERMVLSCEISRPNASVCWYRDGLEVEENDNLILEVDGVYRRLIIPETTVNDSAEYVCDTTDDSVTFFVNIAGASLNC